jgi:DNA repair exonuclease SbcCD ATPase subunit
MSLISTQYTLTESEINNININLKKFAEQIKKDELLKEYGKIIHRDGLPSYLLMKSKDLINCELEDLLVNVDFNVFFDDNLDLVLYDKKTPAILQRLLTCSGAERSFGAVALKMALRTINTKSRPSILLLDEVMLKFKNEMVIKFNEMLLSLKNKVDKIIIIEHVHPVNYDVLIEVEKNTDGISSLNVF